MGFSFFEYLLSFQRYSCFCSKADDVLNRLSVKINHKINHISGKVGVLLLKLGTSNVRQVNNKRTTILILSKSLSAVNHVSLFSTR